ncbi:gamma-glutamyltranspeptidase/glutathione hydrolase [Chromohalobacter marismortui]|uniref:Glutathione hydrolase proenzyme n=1 Tax=Chromohalobacter marismortui TaxID=42055 RepID=A0A4R7NQC6_9GAMM|nr:MULTISPECIES: gamma-glutamyltransferase [Chromohalobacter]MCI0508676.1 gamma-glutamyltransferase [Chromohalobacter sp.]MCI0593480.1 gamma-glutamyltransferase [Chromohalobacter sp.]TDU23154.1 gamma-glutamyltranspeptidase/glutathione hydrolase [Chromohalobacter marismortui]
MFRLTLRHGRRLALYALLATLPLAASAQQAILEGERFHPQEGQHGMAATSHYLASKIARDVMQDGGNAVDAAVTAGFALAVTQPRSGNIGGGGFMLISDEKSGDVIAIDYREKAPGAAYETMFQNEQGEAVSELSRYTHNASGVPGTVAGLALALDEYGTLSLAEALAPAIDLAENGFALPPRFVAGVESARERLEKWPATRAKFFKSDGSSYQVGDIYRQPDLAATLKRIAAQGPREFYEGKTAELIAAEMEKHGGLMTAEDLAAYQPTLRDPVHGTYRGYDVYAMSPPSSGGAHIVQMLNILEGYDIGAMGFNSARTLHVMAEAMKRAYADRAAYLGDTDFVDVPLAGLTSKAYADALREQIDLGRATPSDAIAAGDPLPYESNETTHFSIADDNGLAVSNTYTINFSYGSGIVVDGAGFLLNNEMDDFSAKPGTPNAYGLIGGEANKIEPHKRMLSSMTPTIVKKDGKNFLITGSPGGSRIITTTLQVVMNVIDHDMNIQTAVSVPRIHHQWLPDELRIEQGVSPDTIALLEGMGHTVSQQDAMGAAQSVVIKHDHFYGGADPRRSTSSALGL